MGIQEALKTAATELALITPINGIVVPLEQVPDPVFAKKMLGDGVAIEPVNNRLIAPFDATVSQIQSTGHAISLSHQSGLEVLIHIGIDTVLLNGKGFTARVKNGQQVKQGQTLIEIDFDQVSRTAKSLVTAVVVTNADALSCQLHKAEQQQFIESPQTLMSVSFNATARTVDSQSEKTADSQAETTVNLQPETTTDWQESEPLTLSLQSGLHARPAAALVNIAREFNAEIYLNCKGNEGNAKSVINVLQLDAQLNDQIKILARGEDAKNAIEQLSAAILNGLGDATVASFESNPEDDSQVEEKVTAEASLLFTEQTIENQFKGIEASAGIGFGVIHQLPTATLEVKQTASSLSEELLALDSAIIEARQEICQLKTALTQQGNSDKAAIFSAHLQILSDPEMYQQSVASIRANNSAAYAWQQSYSQQAEKIRALNNAMLQERASDIQDVGIRVLRHILGLGQPLEDIPEQAILIADDLSPSDTVNLEQKNIAAFCTVHGGTTSHSAILARSMSIPLLVGIDAAARDIKNGTAALVNSYQGTLYLSPSEEQLAEQQAQRQAQQLALAENKAHAAKPAITKDGTLIEVAANIGSVAEAKNAIQEQADGVGLLRSEFIFMDRKQAPSEEEQYQIYRAAVEQLKPEQALVVRTLDVGGDKPLAYINIDTEDNPFLGERGIRIGLDQPHLLRTQLRALLRAAQHGNIHIMFPMISDLNELILAKQLLEQERLKLAVKAVPVGMMIEVPSAAIMADIFAEEVDFFSIGTNDLTQYTLAIDRGHSKLGVFADALHPSVLRMIQLTCDAAAKQDKWVGVCGALASDAQAAPILIGLGVSELSVNIPAIAEVKAAVRSLDISSCKSLASRAICMRSAREVRALLQSSLNM
ncbi:phosphoenolpyruvate--protein phosphotransferase [Reinekea thalattae]|uniref:phosphoenolpyruvate--protein phosphotransferase n=1 Tax=Reinekea thalattae TaxID=2593301 RepID=A0A5C8Z3Y7_9GAMM|nr:phosphoenolpyruvate--protein phosphotransferase [Reinekea thalattae]TXR52024.1 phosphoenolpyruvate--protein phosphotransferase [Reinekea thalattae]